MVYKHAISTIVPTRNPRADGVPAVGAGFTGAATPNFPMSGNGGFERQAGSLGGGFGGGTVRQGGFTRTPPNGGFGGFDRSNGYQGGHGFDRSGFDNRGFGGFDRSSYSEQGFDGKTFSPDNNKGFDVSGFDKSGFDKKPYDDESE